MYSNVIILDLAKPTYEHFLPFPSQVQITYVKWVESLIHKTPGPWLKLMIEVRNLECSHGRKKDDEYSLYNMTE